MSKGLILLIPMFFLLAMSIGFANTVTLYPTDDAYTDSANPSTNYGTSDALLVGYIGGSGSYYPRFYLKFNVSSCTGINSSDILNAELYYYQQGAYTGVPNQFLNLYRISTSGYGWAENNITYNNEPSSSTLISYDSFEASCYFLSPSLCTGSNGFESQTNYTTYVKSQVASYDSINFMGQSGYSGGIYSKEASNTAYRPKLEITYNGTLTCNGTGGGGTALQEAHIPSYPNAYQDLKCSAKGSSSESVTFGWYRKASGESSFSLYSMGSSSVVANNWTVVNTLSSSSVLPNAQYYCVVTDTGGSVTSNTATVTNILDIMEVHNPLDRSIGDLQYQTVRFRNIGNQTVYAFVECDWQSPSSIHYYPNDTTLLYGCKQIIPNIAFDNAMYAYKTMNEVGTWNGKSCFLYASNYSDCRIQDLGIQDYTLNETFWEVSATPSITNITISPSNPKMNETMTCSVRAVTNDNTSTIDQLWNYFLINGAFVSPDFQISVANNTVTNFTLNIGGLVSIGDEVSCGAFGVKLSPYTEGGIVYSSSVITRGAKITAISTTPEPQRVGIQKILNYTTEIPTRITKMEWTSPSGINGSAIVTDRLNASTDHYDGLLLSQVGGNDSLLFTENGIYTYTLKSCNCPLVYGVDIDSDAECPQETCAYPASYPTKAYGMRWTVSSNYYLYDLNLYNYTPTVNMGAYQTLSALFSKRTNVFKIVLHKPDLTTKEYFVTNLMENNFSNGITSDGLFAHKILYSGTGEALDQIGNYSVDYYAGYGWVSNISNCLAYNECQYTNSSLGNNFTVAYGSGGYIANVSVNPPSQYFNGEFNISFDTSNVSDESCVRVISPTGTDAYFKKVIKATPNTTWVIPFTTGENKPLEQQGTYTFSIVSCKKSGSASCIDDTGTSCETGSGCAYCMYSFGSNYSVAVTEGAITNVTYKKMIAVGETQVINFQTNPYSDSVFVHLPSRIFGQPDVLIERTANSNFTSWSVSVPYTEILKAISSNTSISYNSISFDVRARIDGEYVQQARDDNGEWLQFDINTSAPLTPDKRVDGTVFGQMIGQAVGLSGIYGDMILALMFASLLSCAVGVLSKEPILTILVFLSTLSVFSLAGMMPFWVILVQVIFAGFLLMRFLSTVFTGND